MSSRRLASGGAWIDRSRELSFTFDGRAMTGFEGDTLASALLANDVDVVARSPILGRPRGVMTAGVEEPNAFVEISAPWFDAIVAATTVPLVDGMVAEGRAGVGRLPAGDVPETRAVHRHVHVETLVIGGGASGRAAATEAAERGHRVILADERHVVDQPPAGVTTLARTTAVGVYDDGYVVLYERSRPVERVWHVRARHVVLASGAHERPIAFAGNDRPGVMLASAARIYVERFGVLPGRRVVVFTTNHTGHDVAAVLADAGAEIVAIVDPARGGPAAERSAARGFDVRHGWAVVGTEGDDSVERVRLAGPGAGADTVLADLVAVSGGWNPALALWRSIGGGLRYDEARSCFVPDANGPSWLSVVGAAAGEVATSVPLWIVRSGDDAEKYVDLQRDQTVADLAAAVGRGLKSVEHVKRATYIGTAIDQGRTSGVLAAEVTNTLLGWGPGAQGPSNARPPSTPVPFSALAGIDRGPTLLDPVRITPIHRWHVAHGAVFEDVGRWKRPRYFPHPGEELDDAVTRECLAVRGGVGVLDASTLGKIEVVGPDAGIFLDRMYTNQMSSLPVGSIRYGLMLGLDGMVFDDGVGMRLAEDRFLVTTTTSGAGPVLDRFEEWLQTEWPDLRVFCTSVTERWAVVAVGGPLAREVVAAVGTDVDLTNEAFPFMTLRDGTVAGVPARLCRISFTGELSFELHVPAWYGLYVWEAVMAAGQSLGVTPYGTETMHVLRAEKGYVIVGQDTDGTVTPHDLGMSWIVNTNKGDFVGKRSLMRSDTVRQDRPQLVGLLPQDVRTRLPEGAQLLASAEVGAPPVPMLGHVTSSYRGSTRPFALAMVKGGQARHGETVYAALAGGVVACTVTEPVFYDPDGARRDG